MKHLIRDIKNGETDSLRAVYASLRNEFILFLIKNYQADKDTATDIFQDTIVTFYYNAKHDKVTEISASLKTYLFSIGKHKYLNYQKKFSHNGNLEGIEWINEQENSYSAFMKEDDKQLMIESVREHMKKLSDDDRQILELYYLKEYDMDSIAREMGLKNGNVAKKKKFYAFKKLMNLVKNNLPSLLLL